MFPPVLDFSDRVNSLTTVSGVVQVVFYPRSWGNTEINKKKQFIDNIIILLYIIAIA